MQKFFIMLLAAAALMSCSDKENAPAASTPSAATPSSGDALPAPDVSAVTAPDVSATPDVVTKPAAEEPPPLDCVNADWAKCLEKALALEKEPQQTERLKLLVDTCNGDPKKSDTSPLNSTLACSSAAGILLDGASDVKKDKAQAATLLERGCENGSVEACTIAGYHWLSGEFGEKNVEKSIPLLQKSCDGGDAKSCNTVAEVKALAALGPVDSWASKCDADDNKACLALGAALEEGKNGLAKDAKAAGKHYKKACDLKNADGCTSLGLLYVNGGLKGGFKKGSKALKKGCKLKSGAACYFLGQAETPGKKKFIKHLTRSCELKYAEGCFSLGVAYQRNFIKNDDPSIAKGWFEKGCALGHTASCGHAK